MRVIKLVLKCIDRLTPNYYNDGKTRCERLTNDQSFTKTNKQNFPMPTSREQPICRVASSTFIFLLADGDVSLFPMNSVMVEKHCHHCCRLLVIQYVKENVTIRLNFNCLPDRTHAVTQWSQGA